MATLTTGANRLRTVREAQDLSLREAARRSGIDAAQLSRVERGESGLSINSLHALARVLGLRDLARVLAPYVDAER
jgi:transcriptional regulator with XRE-family HTH domain